MGFLLGGRYTSSQSGRYGSGASRGQSNEGDVKAGDTFNNRPGEAYVSRGVDAGLQGKLGSFAALPRTQNFLARLRQLTPVRILVPPGFCPQASRARAGWPFHTRQTFRSVERSPQLNDPDRLHQLFRSR